MSTVGIVGKSDSAFVIADTFDTDALTSSVYGSRAIALEVHSWGHDCNIRERGDVEMV